MYVNPTNVCKYIQIFVNTKSLTPVGCQNIGHCPCGLPEAGNMITPRRAAPIRYRLHQKGK